MKVEWIEVGLNVYRIATINKVTRYKENKSICIHYGVSSSSHYYNTEQETIDAYFKIKSVLLDK